MKIRVLTFLLVITAILSGCGKEKDDFPDATVSIETEQKDNEEASTGTAEATAAPIATANPTAAPTAKPEVTVAPSASPEITVNPTATPPAIVSPTVTPVATPVATSKPSGSDSGKEKESGSATAKPAATVKPTVAPTVKPTATPKPTAKPTATPKPTAKPTATPKPTATVKPTTAPTVKPTATPKPTVTPATPAHTCSWDNGNITTTPTCKSEGTKTYTCSVCHNIKTETLAKKDHNYVTESDAPTCTEAGKAYQVCVDCGQLGTVSEGATALGHHYEKVYVMYEPTCRTGAYYVLSCTECNEEGGSGMDGALPHTPVEGRVQEGNCADPTIIDYVCSECGAPCGTKEYYHDDHNWVEKETDPYWSDEAFAFVTDTIIVCSRCNKEKD